MADSFKEWAKASTDWGDALLQLGASWDTFRGDQEVVMKDLVEGGIPRLAARSIFNLAAEAIRRNEAPMAVFWDLESYPVPPGLHCEDIVEKMKQTLSQYGLLVQFRCYLSSSSDDPLNAKERVDLLAAGCYPVGRSYALCSTESMISVDAMKFAYTHADCATLCFIIDPVRHLYLLSDLQQSCWRTVVVSNTHAVTTLEDHWNTLSLVWNEINGAPNSPSSSGPPPGFERLSRNGDGASTVEALSSSSEERSFSDVPEESTDAEVEILRDGLVPITLPHRCNSSGFTSGLPNSSSRTASWLPVCNRSIKRDPSNKPVAHAIPIVEDLPVPFDELPLERMMVQGKIRPFVLYLRWIFCKKQLQDYKFPKEQCYIIKDTSGMILMFKNRDEVERIARDLECLRKGVLVDWQKVMEKRNSFPCAVCQQTFHGNNMVAASNRAKFYCRNCYDWGTPAVKKAAFLALSSTMHFFEVNDDLLVSEGILRKALVDQHGECASREQAALWIEGAVREKFIVQVKTSGSKSRMLCLPSLEAYATSDQVHVTISTSAEEAHVLRLLKGTSGGWMKREAVIANLKSNFDSMQTPFQRFKLLENGRLNGRFFLVKSPHMQLVALSEEIAKSELGRHPWNQS